MYRKRQIAGTNGSFDNRQKLAQGGAANTNPSMNAKRALLNPNAQSRTETNGAIGANTNVIRQYGPSDKSAPMEIPQQYPNIGSGNANQTESVGQPETGEHMSKWQNYIDGVINDITNREAFSYDMNADPLYQQYKDQYTRQGQLAMEDTIGQAAAMTGGYGNSYAQGVGQQAYQGYMQQLNDKGLEMYQMALDRYNQEGQDLYNQYGLFADRENQDYGRYVNDRNFNYQKERDKVADSQWDKTFGYQQERDKVADSQWDAEFNEAKRQFDLQHSGSSNGGSGGGYSGGYDTHGFTKDEIMEIQRSAGIAVDGIWGPDTENAYNSGYRPGGDLITQVAGYLETIPFSDDPESADFQTAYAYLNELVGPVINSDEFDELWAKYINQDF